MNPDLDKETTLKCRQIFFDDLLAEWALPPEPIDDVMGQSVYALTPDKPEAPGAVAINSPERGILAQSFARPETWGNGVSFAYSIYMAGDWLRFGVLLLGDGAALEAFEGNRQSQLDVEFVWDRPSDKIRRRANALLMEWRFVEPDFYTNFAIRERFVRLARHLHFRLGQTVFESRVSSLTDSEW